MNSTRLLAGAGRATWRLTIRPTESDSNVGSHERRRCRKRLLLRGSCVVHPATKLGLRRGGSERMCSCLDLCVANTSCAIGESSASDKRRSPGTVRTRTTRRRIPEIASVAVLQNRQSLEVCRTIQSVSVDSCTAEHMQGVGRIDSCKGLGANARERTSKSSLSRNVGVNRCTRKKTDT